MAEIKSPKNPPPMAAAGLLGLELVTPDTDSLFKNLFNILRLKES